MYLQGFQPSFCTKNVSPTFPHLSTLSKQLSSTRPNLRASLRTLMCVWWHRIFKQAVSGMLWRIANLTNPTQVCELLSARQPTGSGNSLQWHTSRRHHNESRQHSSRRHDHSFRHRTASFLPAHSPGVLHSSRIRRPPLRSCDCAREPHPQRTGFALDLSKRR